MRFAGWILGSVFLLGQLEAADLTLSYTVPAQVAIDWDGMNSMDGDGSLTFSTLGESQAATLSVLCNSVNGYQVTVHSPNASTANTSALANGPHQIAYSVSMDTSGVQNANVTANLVLNDAAQPSLDVNFTGGTLPLDGSNPANTNQVQFNITLDSFDGSLKPQGLYTDVITATVVLN